MRHLLEGACSLAVRPGQRSRVPPGLGAAGCVPAPGLSVIFGIWLFWPRPGEGRLVSCDSVRACPPPALTPPCSGRLCLCLLSSPVFCRWGHPGEGLVPTQCPPRPPPSHSLPAQGPCPLRKPQVEAGGTLHIPGALTPPQHGALHDPLCSDVYTCWACSLPAQGAGARFPFFLIPHEQCPSGT